MRINFDLHNHSTLSPCGSEAMLPSVVALEAFERGLDLIALTDHNSCRNIEVFAQACEIVGIVGIYGLEVTTIEEVHVLALFENVSTAVEFGNYIEASLPNHPNHRDLFGAQLIVNLQGEVIGEVEKSLYGAAPLSIDQLVDEVHDLGGLVIPAHIDRMVDSLVANLGFIPNLAFDALEAVHPQVLAKTTPFTLIQGSDAHHLNQIAQRYCWAEGEAVTFNSLKRALKTNQISYPY